MNLIKKSIRLSRKNLKEYVFAWGAIIDADMIEAIICRKPEFISNATLNDFELCIQTLTDIPTAEPNPRKILQRAWGNNFKSYAIRRRKGKKVTGVIYRITSYERKMIDAWELVPEGWFESIKVNVSAKDGRVYKARTQALPASHDDGQGVNGLSYEPWIVSKEKLLKIAHKDSKRYPDYVY